MKFLYSKEAKNERIRLEGEAFLHLKARRAKIGERIDVRNLTDGQNHIYEIINLDKRGAELNLIFSHDVEAPNSDLALAWAIVEARNSDLALAWAIVDPKTIEKTLPSLNEIGIAKIVFFYGEFSQKNFKLDFSRLERILISSCEQCGRNDLMKFEIYKSLDELVKFYPNVALIDFEGENLDGYAGKEILAIGPEGGFSRSERETVAKKYGLKAKNILRSQTAILGVTAKILI